MARATALCCMLLLVGCSQEARIKRLGKDCDTGDASACGRLLGVAKDVRDRSTALLAVEQLKSADALVEVAVGVSIFEGGDVVCYAAIERVRSADALHKFLMLPATQSVSNGCKQSAFRRLTDPDQIVEAIAQHKYATEAWWPLLDGPTLNDDALVRLLYVGVDNESSREVARRIKDQARLAAVATDASANTLARAWAIENLVDRKVLNALTRDPVKGLAEDAQKRLSALK